MQAAKREDPQTLANAMVNRSMPLNQLLRKWQEMPEEQRKAAQEKWAEETRRRRQEVEKIEARQLEERRRQRAQDLLKGCQVPALHAESDLEADAAAFAAKDWAPHKAKYQLVSSALFGLMQNPGMIALLGTRGCGKTRMACGTVRAFCLEGRTAIYRRVLDFFLDVKATFDKRDEGNVTQREVIARYCRPELLVLDEIQVRSDTDWENVLLTDLVDRRYAARKSTIFVANLGPEEFFRRVGDSITSRINECGGYFVCDWPSFRDR